MKRILFFATLLSTTLVINAMAQSGQSPTMQQSTSTTQKSGPKPTIKKTNRRDRLKKMETALDTTLPANRPQRRLRPDSLRRGGATRVDSI